MNGWIIVALVAILAGLGGILLGQSSRLKSLKNELENEWEKTNQAIRKQEGITTVHNSQQAIQEAADERKNDLEKTDDSDLVDRANSLFP